MMPYNECEDCKRMVEAGVDVEICVRCGHYYKDGEICSCM